MINVFLPFPANVVAKLLLVVVFPTPPFPPTNIHLRVSCSKMFFRLPSNYINLIDMNEQVYRQEVVNIFINNQKMLTEVEIHGETHDKIKEILEQCPQEIKPTLRSMLIEDASCFYSKKLKQQEAKERVKKMEEDYEAQRQKKRQLFKDKQNKSAMVKQRNMELLLKKFKRHSDHYKSVVAKIQTKNQAEIQRKLSLRSEIYNKDQTYLSRALSKTSKDHLKISRTEPFRAANIDVEKKIQDINHKALKAQQIHDAYQQQIVQKIREKSKALDDVKQKIVDKTIKEEEKVVKECYEKNEDIERHFNRAKTYNQKKILDKRKSVKEKLDKCSQNLRHLSYAEEEKFNQLEQKLGKRYQHKEWKDERLEKYWQKWEQNSRRIELEKESKAEAIINKQNYRALKNKLYKEKKDKLLEALKKNME